MLKIGNRVQDINAGHPRLYKEYGTVVALYNHLARVRFDNAGVVDILTRNLLVTNQEESAMYIVWTKAPQAKNPQVIHTTEAKATNEAERLAGLSGHKFFVARLVSCSEQTKVITTKL